MIVEHVKAEFNATVAASLTFAAKTTVSAVVPVAAGQYVTCDFYNRGYYSDGTMSYYVRDTSGGVQYTEEVGVGALLPMKNSYACHVY